LLDGVDERVDERTIEAGINVQVAPAVALGEPRQKVWLLVRLVREDEQEPDRMA